MKTDGIHTNSVAAYYTPDNIAAFNQRERLILSALAQMGTATTRQIQQFLDMPELGMCQPRISDLCRKGTIEECGRSVCEFTGQKVRLLRIAQKPDEGQMEIAI